MPNFKKYNRNNDSKEERQFKYQLSKALGFNSSWAKAMRDMSLKRIAKISNAGII